MPQMGEEFVVEVETATVGVYVTVEFMNSHSKSFGGGSQEFPVFSGVPLVIAAETGETFAIGGFYDKADAGQLRLIAMARAGTSTKLKVLPDGVNGFTQSVKVLSYKHDASAGENFQTISFEFKADAAAVISGTGPIL